MTRVLIVGAGPAGIRAAETLVAAGLHPVVVDEGARAGGQIYRRPPAGFTRPPESLYGAEATKARALHATFDAMAAKGALTHLAESAVLALKPGQALVAGPEGTRWLAHDRLILATGATDRVAPVLGWQRGGVFTLGAMQIALKAQGVALGARIVLAGSGPLLTLVAHQLRHAGAEVAAVLDTSPWRDQVLGGARMAFARPWVTLRGIAMRAGLRGLYHAGVQLDEITPEAVRWRDKQGRAHLTAYDAVGLGWHLRAESHLADLAGAAFAWSDLWQQWLPEADTMGRAGPGLYLAGDNVRLMGADAAECGGRLAAMACLQDLGHACDLRADLRADLRRARRMARFAKGVARAFPWPAAQIAGLPDATTICRCEGITAGTIRATAPRAGGEANRLKSLARPGMGRCQGRYCGQAAAEVLAAACQIPVAETGRLRAQAPLRPVPISTLAEL